MNRELSVVNVQRLHPSKFKEIYTISVNIDGAPALVLVGKQETEIGIDILSGGDILQFFKTDKEVHSLIREAIAECDEA